MRDYDPAIGRWLGIDPVTHFSQSPYNAFDGNPVSIADPSGADGIGGEHFTSVFGMQVSTPTNTGMYTGMSDNGSLIPSGTSVDSMYGDGGILPYARDFATMQNILSYVAGVLKPSHSSVSVGNLELGSGVVNWFNKDRDGALWELANNDTTNEANALTLYTHGNTHVIFGPNSEEIQTFEQLNFFLSKESDRWNNFIKNGGNFKLTLISCYTGAFGAKSFGVITSRNIARDFSYDASSSKRVHRNLTVVAPSGLIKAFNFFGPRYFYWDNQGKFEWNIYRGGHFIRGYNN